VRLSLSLTETRPFIIHPFSDVNIEPNQTGLVFIPDSIGYLIGTSLFAKPALQIGRLLMAKVALLLVGVCAILVSMYHPRSSLTKFRSALRRFYR
jgi:hypothetical protein